MTIYTGVADANGDFIVPFSSAYTSGEKIIVTAEKDSAQKTIELFAPSGVTGGGVIQFTGNLNNFPLNIGGIVLNGINELGSAAFRGLSGGIWIRGTSLTINSTLKVIPANAFDDWELATELNLPTSIVEIKTSAFSGWVKLKKLILHENITILGSAAFNALIACDEIECRAVTPPSITSNTFNNLKAACIFKVPAASVAAYQAAANWSAFAARIQAI